MRKITLWLLAAILRLVRSIKRTAKKHNPLSRKPIALVCALRATGKRVIAVMDNRGQQNVYRCIFADGTQSVYSVNYRRSTAKKLF